jgi:hypothetical protein
MSIQSDLSALKADWLAFVARIKAFFTKKA